MKTNERFVGIYIFGRSYVDYEFNPFSDEKRNDQIETEYEFRIKLKLY